jgi:hypothetical protein
LKIGVERSLRYLGIGYIRLELLYFEEYIPDIANIEYLKTSFQNEYYYRLREENHIPTVINKQTFTKAIKKLGPRVSE